MSPERYGAQEQATTRLDEPPVSAPLRARERNPAASMHGPASGTKTTDTYNDQEELTAQT